MDHTPWSSLPKTKDFLVDGARRTVTPEIASWIKHDFQFEWQRIIDWNHVHALAAEMMHGSFDDATQMTFGVYNGKYYLLDGWHRLSAVEESLLAQTFMIRVIKCETEDGLRRAYYRIDTVAKKRGPAAINKAMGLAEKLGISKETAGRAMQCAHILYANVRILPPGKRDPFLKSPDGQANALLPWAAELQKFDQITRQEGKGVIAHHVRQIMIGQSFMAMSVYVLKYSPKAKEFLSGFATQKWYDGPDDPRKTLLNSIINGKNRDIILLFAHAWNAFTTDTRVRSLSISRKNPDGSITPSELRINETPLTKGRRK